MFLKKQIVSGSYMIVFVSFETLASIFNVDVVLGKVLQNLGVNWDLVYSYYSTSEVFLTFDEVKPRVFSDIVYFVSFFRIRIKNACY